MAFNLSIYPWVFKSRYENGIWNKAYDEKPHLSPQEEAALSPADLSELLNKRNSFPDLPLVNYTTQYGMGCFEGVKAFPQKDGSLKVFRPDENAARMKHSMAGLHMPTMDEGELTEAILTTVKKNAGMGFKPAYNKDWEMDDYLSGHAVYIRPFSYSEPAIGLGLSQNPWIVIVTTPVGSYFKPGSNKAVTTDKIRATPKGTGWIKCDANYVIPTLAKKEAEAEGYMEAVFLDAAEQKYVEEGSSCNFFVLLDNGTLVTPVLGDTILPGITRKSIITLAEDRGVKVEERKLTIDEVLESGKECFVTGTAAGLTHFESLTHKGKTRDFGDGSIGELSHELLTTLKGIQYGAREDKFNWMADLPS